jgi:hypothetical protein
MSPVSLFVPLDGLRRPMVERDCGELVAEMGLWARSPGEM